jgi:hypothetical protein
MARLLLAGGSYRVLRGLAICRLSDNAKRPIESHEIVVSGLSANVFVRPDKIARRKTLDPADRN